MKKKIITLGILGMFLLTSIASVGVLADKQQIRAQNIIKPSEDGLDQIFSVVEKQVSINPMLKKIMKQIIKSSDNGDIFDELPGFYQFSPCSSIDIEGVGTIAENNSHLAVYLHDGTADLNNSYSDIFIEWEIAAAIILINFSGEWEGSQDFPFKPLSITGESEYAFLMEFSYLLEIDVKRDKYERENDIPVKVERLVFIFNPLKTVKIVNPHFYVYHITLEDEEIELIREEILQETWEISFSKTKTWKWNQKDNGGEQVPDGDYGFAGEFEVEGRVHPVIGDGVEIVEELSRNIRNNRILLAQILDKFFNSIPMLRNLLRLL